MTNLRYRLGLVLAPLAAVACLAVPYSVRRLGDEAPVAWNPNGVHAWDRVCWWTPPNLPEPPTASEGEPAE